MRIGNLNCRDGALLAPLAGVSNRPFRVLAARFGAAVTFTEMISSEGVIRGQKRTLEMMKFGPDEQPIGIQLFGANPEVMRQAARIAAKQFAPDLIDINFGCPVNKVVRKNGGAAVLKDLALTRDIIQATVEGADETPVTVKMRTGWDDTVPVYIEVAQIAQESGVKAVTLHARSRSSGYSGSANWEAIKNLKESVHVPVVGNGDILSAQDAGRMIQQTGCDAVMVGRAALGNPFIFSQINHYLSTGEIPDEPSVTEKIQTAILHARLVASQYGEERGIRMMRRHLGWYVRAMTGASQLRARLFKVSEIRDIEAIFDEYLKDQDINSN